MTSPTEPYGCAHCGIAKNRHGWRWITGWGGHRWVAPDNELILARMRKRRVDRKGTK